MKIETNIPAPIDHRQKYPFIDMIVGDSVFFVGETSKGKISNAARKVAARSGKHFVVRTQDGGLRIWRTK